MTADGDFPLPSTAFSSLRYSAQSLLNVMQFLAAQIPPALADIGFMTRPVNKHNTKGERKEERIANALNIACPKSWQRLRVIKR